jgi:hypothetical protein
VLWVLSGFCALGTLAMIVVGLRRNPEASSW